MTRNIGTDANIDQVRLKQETAHPSSPASGYELLYIISGSAHGGMFLKDSSGRQIGPFITGTPAQTVTDANFVMTSGTASITLARVVPWLGNYSADNAPSSPNSANDEFTSASLGSQWTSVGSPDTISTSQYPGYLWVEDNESTPCGIRNAYTPGANALTVVIKVSGLLSTGFANIVLALEDSGPATLGGLGVQNNNSGALRTREILAAETNTTLPGSSTTPTDTYYLMVQRDNSTNYTFKVSLDGKSWWVVKTGSHAGTIANVSVLMDSQGGGSTNSSMSVDFIRFFTSQTNTIGATP